MVGNLVSNAIRYTGRGGVVVGCRHHHAKLWVEVWDSGIGIPKDKIAEIFEEFTQLGNNERNCEKGGGLGLAIVRKTASLLGLQIRVLSRPGRGSMFAVELPTADLPALVPPQAEALMPPSLRVAVVEDDANVRYSLVYALQELGHQVVAAPTASELVASLGTFPPDIIMADYRLAGPETGVDAIALVRAAFGEMVKAVILTGDTEPVIVHGLAAKGFGVEFKPVTIDKLKSCIAQLMGPFPA
jgi:CheY-like chemotaxis protein